MKISEIRNRWNTSQGYNKRENILKALKNNISLEGYAEMIDNRWDLRGIKLASPQIRQEVLSDFVVSINDNTLEFKDVSLENIDFSYADLSYTLWTRCQFENLLMYSTNFSNVRLWACSITNSDIEKTNFSGSLLGSRIKKNSGIYENVVFKNSNFKNSAYNFPLFSHCSFIDCNLKNVDFDGSRFENCYFEGELFGTIFRGITSMYDKRFFWERSINPYDFPNKMLNVDFSNAQFKGVTLINGVDINTCKLPLQGQYLLISQLDLIYKQARKIIERDWNGDDKKFGLRIINSDLNNRTKNQKQFIFDKAILMEYFKPEFADHFFELIEQLHSKIDC